MYTTMQDTMDMISDYLNGTLTRADTEAWADLERFARAILATPEPEEHDLDAPHILPEDFAV